MSELIPQHGVLRQTQQEPDCEATYRDEVKALVTPAREVANAPETVKTSKPHNVATVPINTDLADEKTTLFPVNESNQMRARWDRIQVEFIDQPRKSVEEANALVADAMARLTAVFNQERQEMEQQWDRKQDVSTEDLRQALRRYRTFFTRLLTV
jgi:hypothetical protein